MSDEELLAAETTPPDELAGRVTWALVVAADYGQDGASQTGWGNPEVDGLIEAVCILAHALTSVAVEYAHLEATS